MATKNEERRYVVRTGFTCNEQWWLKTADIQDDETNNLKEARRVTSEEAYKIFDRYKAEYTIFLANAEPGTYGVRRLRAKAKPDIAAPLASDTIEGDTVETYLDTECYGGRRVCLNTTCGMHGQEAMAAMCGTDVDELIKRLQELRALL